MRHLLQDLKGIFHYYMTCVVEHWVGSHYCLLIWKNIGKKKIAISPPPGVQAVLFTSLWLYLPT